MKRGALALGILVLAAAGVFAGLQLAERRMARQSQWSCSWSLFCTPTQRP